MKCIDNFWIITIICCGLRHSCQANLNNCKGRNGPFCSPRKEYLLLLLFFRVHCIVAGGKKTYTKTYLDTSPISIYFSVGKHLLISKIWIMILVSLTVHLFCCWKVIIICHNKHHWLINLHKASIIHINVSWNFMKLQNSITFFVI